MWLFTLSVHSCCWVLGICFTLSLNDSIRFAIPTHGVWELSWLILALVHVVCAHVCGGQQTPLNVTPQDLALKKYLIFKS